MAVRGRAEMIRAMAPELQPGRWHFVALSDGAAVPAAALASFREGEGLSVILPEPAARAVGADLSQPMAWITLTVASALDGVGLTAAAAGTLAEAGCPCNVVAALHHDHLFVPSRRGEEALALLRARARAEPGGEGEG